ncbi:MAG: hypothetical protein WDM78_11625 [Puia sp.]
MIEINNVKYRNSWNELTLNDFFELKGIDSSPNYEDLIDKDIKLLSKLSGVDEDTLANENTVIQIKKTLSHLPFLHTEPIGNWQEYYKVGKKLYHLIPLSEWNGAMLMHLTNILNKMILF